MLSEVACDTITRMMPQLETVRDAHMIHPLEIVQNSIHYHQIVQLGD